MKLFNLELKYNDPMKLAYEIRAIFHDISSRDNFNLTEQIPKCFN